MGSSHSIYEDLDPLFPKIYKFCRIPNLSNTCYINCIIQCFINSKTIHDYFSSLVMIGIDTIAENCGKNSPLVEYAKIFNEIESNLELEIMIKPKPLVNSIFKSSSCFIQGEQNDSHELLLFLIESFDNSIKTLEQKLPHFAHPPFSKLFEGKKHITFDCLACHTPQINAESFMCLTLPIKHGQSIQTLIMDTMKEIMVEKNDGWFCESCKQKEEAKMSTVFETIPMILIFQLNRFSFDKNTLKVTKDFGFVDVPDKIVANWKGGTQIYEIKTMVLHVGNNLTKGHFVSILRVNNVWILANDKVLKYVPDDEIDAYIGSLYQLSAVVPYLVWYECQP